MRAYQTQIQTETLYECVASGSGDGSSLAPFIEVVGGTANVYGSVERPSNPPEDMSLATEDPFEGIIPFGIVPNFMFVTEETGSISSVILSGIDATETTTA